MRRLFGPALTTICAAALLALLIYGLSSQGDSRSLDAALSAGRHPSAPDRVLPMLGSNVSRSIANWRGHVVVLNFWASWCVPCEDEAPLMEQAQRGPLARIGGTVLGITWRDAAPDSISFIHQHGLTYPSLRDVDGALATAYGTSALPETFILDPTLHVVGISRGEVTQAFLDREIALAAKE